MDLVQIISQVGFPIAVAAYSLIRLEKVMTDNTKVMTLIAERLKVDTDVK